jgi:hypothetical protein
MNEPVKDGVGEGWVADGLVSMFDGQLACYDGRGAAMTVFEDFQ